MPKIKTSKTLLKRVKLNKKGKMSRRHIQTSHLRGSESVGTRARKSKLVSFSKTFENKLRKLLG